MADIRNPRKNPRCGSSNPKSRLILGLNRLNTHRRTGYFPTSREPRNGPPSMARHERSPVNLSPCAAELRRHDPDRFLTGLFAPGERREALFALYTFNLEVARSREMVREPMLGRMRLQWWRETIDGDRKSTRLNSSH